jgi:hypothetical protein
LSRLLFEKIWLPYVDRLTITLWEYYYLFSKLLQKNFIIHLFLSEKNNTSYKREKYYCLHWEIIHHSPPLLFGKIPRRKNCSFSLTPLLTGKNTTAHFSKIVGSFFSSFIWTNTTRCFKKNSPSFLPSLFGKHSIPLLY